MPFPQWLILNIPTVIIGLVMLAVAVGTAVGGVLLVRRYMPVGKLKQHHDIAGPIFSTIGVIYAVMLTFVLVIVWQDFDQARVNSIIEANYYADIYKDLNGLSDPFRSEARTALGEYLDAVINDEWKLMAAGQPSTKAQEMNTKYWDMYCAYQPKTDGEKIFYAEILSRMNDAGEMRRHRLADAATGVHPVLWLVLLVGGFITVAFAFFFGSENLRAQLIMTTLLAVLIVLILFTILVMDYPFSGDMDVGSQAFQQVLMHVK